MAEPFLNGIRVLDLSQLLPGPYATTILADYGADVIKVERPDGGDPVRQRSPQLDGRSYTLLARNRNKRSVAIDLKHERGHEAFLELAKTADVVVEAFRPGVVDRLGVGYEDVRPINKDIVYCSISGFGQTGPYAEMPGHDINYVGVAGLLGLTGEPDGEPVIPGYTIADLAGGTWAATSILMALVGSLRGSGGDYVDVSMTDVVASFATTYLDTYEREGRFPRRGKTNLNGYHPGYRAYETADGLYLTIGALESHFWVNLCEALDLPEYVDHHINVNDRLENAVRTEIVEAFAEKIGSRSREKWLDVFADHDVPAAPVNEYEELFEDPHLRSRGLFEDLVIETTDGKETITQINSPSKFRRDRQVEKEPPDRLGASTRDILAKLGYDDQTIEEMAADGAIATGLAE